MTYKKKLTASKKQNKTKLMKIDTLNTHLQPFHQLKRINILIVILYTVYIL